MLCVTVSYIGIHNVETCIKAVCDLAGCKPDRLPSKSTLAKAVLHMQIAECVLAFDSNILPQMEPRSLVRSTVSFK
jgi:hypothetical protein